MKNKNRIITWFFMILFISITLVGCSKSSSKKDEPLSRTELFMGTVVKITLYDGQSDKVLDEAFEKVKEIEDLVSINKIGTELDKVNEQAGKSSVTVSDITFDIVEKGVEYSNKTNGAFDLTIGPLVKLWSIGLPEAKVPTNDEIIEAISLINFNDVELNKSEKSIFLKNENMIIDLGGIAKGYAADEIAKILLSNNVKSAIIDLGGNLVTLGNKPSGEEWRIGIQDPFSTRGDIVGTVKLSNKTIVTSGIYERYIEENGIKYHHILDPKTGYPYDNELAGVSIITNKSVDADGLSTSIFAEGLIDGLSFVEDLDDVEAIFITKDKKVYMTSGIKGSYSVTNAEFEVMN